MSDLLATCACGKSIKARATKDGDGLKTPRGWKKIEQVLTCPICLDNAYLKRSVRVSIMGLGKQEDREIQEFRAAMIAASKASAQFGNWYVQILYSRDPAVSQRPGQWAKTKDGKPKLPALPEIDYYRDATLRFPELAPASIVALAKMVRGWYSKRRFDALVMLSRSIENYRFGFLPIEIPKQAWSLIAGADGYFSVRTQIGPGKSWLVRVYADPIQLARLRAMHEGAAERLSLKIVRRRETWFFRISALLAKPTKSTRQSHVERTLTLGHDAESLLYGAVEDIEDVFIFPGVELQRLIAGGDRTDRRWQVEHSLTGGLMSRRKQHRWRKDRTRQSESRQRKIAAQLQLVAASLARWCVIRGVTSVDYETTDRGFIPHFPYYRFTDAIRNALEGVGVALHVIETESAALVGPRSETNVAV